MGVKKRASTASELGRRIRQLEADTASTLTLIEEQVNAALASEGSEPAAIGGLFRAQGLLVSSRLSLVVASQELRQNDEDKQAG